MSLRIWDAKIIACMAVLLASGAVDAAAASVVNGTASDPVEIARSVDRGDFSSLDAISLEDLPPSSRALVQAQRAASRLDYRSVRHRLAEFRLSKSQATAELAVAAEVDASTSFAAARYHDAWRAAVRYGELERRLGDANGVADAAQTAAVARILARMPPQRLRMSELRPVTSRRDAAGLVRIDVSFGGRELSMVVDTGANISVLSESAASRLGVRILGGPASVAASAANAVPVRIALADNLEFGGLHFRNAAFLVLRDADLSLPLPGGYGIDGILGFPLFRQTGGASFGPGATFMGVAPSEAASAATDLRVSGSDLFATAMVAGHRTDLHLDTGAASTDLTAAFLEKHPTMLAGAPRHRAHVAGAGGSKEIDVAKLAAVPIRLGNAATVTMDLDVSTSDAPQPIKWMGTLGQDVLKRWRWWGIDLRRMRLLAGPGIEG